MWADAYLKLVNRAAHDVRNPLNGAAVNVEVLRSRASRSDMTAASLAPFADAAAAELERTVKLVDALLAMARPAPYPVDLIALLQPLLIVYAEMALRQGGLLEVDLTEGTIIESAEQAEACRLIVASALEAAAARPGAAALRMSEDDDGVMLTVRSEAGPLEIPPAVLRSAEEAAIRCHKIPEGVTILIQPAARARAGAKQEHR